VNRTEQDIRVVAPAKVNLILKVLDRRPDGYHNIWSLMHTVGLEDELRFRLSPRSTGVRLHCDDAALPTDGRNLVSQAASLVLERAGLPADRAMGGRSVSPSGFRSQPDWPGAAVMLQPPLPA